MKSVYIVGKLSPGKLGTRQFTVGFPLTGDTLTRTNRVSLAHTCTCLRLRHNDPGSYRLRVVKPCFVHRKVLPS